MRTESTQITNEPSRLRVLAVARQTAIIEERSKPSVIPDVLLFIAGLAAILFVCIVMGGC